MIEHHGAARLFDRRVQYCQFKIQSSVSLIDDEIDRLSQRLLLYKSQVYELQDKAQDLDNQIETARISKEGFYRIQYADYSTTFAQIRARHLQEIRELKEYHSTEFIQVQQQFDEILQNIKNSNSGPLSLNRNQAEQMEFLDREIEKVKSQINSYQEAIQEQTKINEINLSQIPDTTYQSINSPVILELNRLIEERQKERYKVLEDSKTKLNECLETLQSMSRQHSINVRTLTDKIRNLDKEYQITIQKLSENQEIAMTKLNKELADAEFRDKKLTKTINKLERGNQKQLRDTKQQLLALENHQIPVNNSKELEEYNREKKELKTSVSRLLKKLGVNESLLKEKRNENQQLKREIGDVKHEIRFVGRKAGQRSPK